MATQAVAQGNSVASEAMNTASQIITAAQAVASEAINKLSLEIGAGVSKVCVVEAGKSTCADYASDAAVEDLKKVADMLSNVGGSNVLDTIASTLSKFNIGAVMGYALLIAISSFVAYLASLWPLHGIRALLLSALALLSVVVTGCMLAVMLVIGYLRSKASGTIGSAGSLESSPCLTDAIVCFVTSAVQSFASLVHLWRTRSVAPSQPSSATATAAATTATAAQPKAANTTT